MAPKKNKKAPLVDWKGDWAARLDDRGYHVVAAKRHPVAARWDMCV